MTNKAIGKYGEELAKDFLINQGYKILDMNYHYSKMSEIDIIATKDNILHFVEVKTRTQNFFGTPLEAINQNKIKQIYSCALFYMQNSKQKYKKYQIDGIGIILNKDKKPEFNFVENITI